MADNYCFFRTTSDDRPLVRQVVKLADKNRKTLGFIPFGALEENGYKGNLFICEKNGIVLGYIFYNYLKTTHIVKIIHFCVDSSVRESGVATRMFAEFKKIFKDALCIELACRDDYLLGAFWKRLGFYIKSSRPGRAVHFSSSLHIYRYDLQQNLLTIIFDEDIKTRVALDSCIIFLATDGCGDSKKELDALLRLEGDVNYFVTQEVYEEISRKKDDFTKQASLECVKQYTTLKANYTDAISLADKVKGLFPRLSSS